MDACAPPLLRFDDRGRSRGHRRFRVSFAVGGRFLFRGRDPLSRFLVRRRTARRRRHYARRDRVASDSPIVHSFAHARLRSNVARLSRAQEASNVFHTLIHSLWKARGATNDDAYSRRHVRASSRSTRLSEIHYRASAGGAGLRDRHAANARALRPCAIDGGQPASTGQAPRRWTRAPIGLIVPVCRFPSTRSCRAPRK
jgi:hypothetical protein